MSASPEFIVLGGKQRTRVFQGDDAGSVMVGGSTKHYRDPLIIIERQEKELLMIGVERQKRIESGQVSWCSHKDHEGERELPIERFSKDSARANGRASYCKKCRAKARVSTYAEKAAVEGRNVRKYERRSPSPG